MNPDKYFKLTGKKEPKAKPKTRPLPKATENYLKAEEDITKALDFFEIKYEKKFHIKSTKRWRFDFHLIEYKILVEIAGGPWSAGRKRKQIAYDADREDTAHELGYTIVRIESAPRFKINESGPMQIRAHFASEWIKNLKRHTFNGPDQTLPSNGLT